MSLAKLSSAQLTVIELESKIAPSYLSQFFGFMGGHGGFGGGYASPYQSSTCGVNFPEPQIYQSCWPFYGPSVPQPPVIEPPPIPEFNCPVIEPPICDVPDVPVPPVFEPPDIPSFDPPSFDPPGCHIPDIPPPPVYEPPVIPPPVHEPPVCIVPDPPCPPPVEPPVCPPPEPPVDLVCIDEGSNGIYGDPHVDVITLNGSTVNYDHTGYNDGVYDIFEGDDMQILGKYDTSSANAPQYITDAYIDVNGHNVAFDNTGALAIDGQAITQPGQYNIGNGGYVQLNEVNQYGEHTIELHNDVDSRVDFWTNGVDFKIDPAGCYEEGSLGGLLGDTIAQNGIPSQLANAANQADQYLVYA